MGEDRGVWWMTRRETWGTVALNRTESSLFIGTSVFRTGLRESLQRGLQWSLQLNPVFYKLDRLPCPALGSEKDLGMVEKGGCAYKYNS